MRLALADSLALVDDLEFGLSPAILDLGLGEEDWDSDWDSESELLELLGLEVDFSRRALASSKSNCPGMRPLFSSRAFFHSDSPPSPPAMASAVQHVDFGVDFDFGVDVGFGVDDGNVGVRDILDEKDGLNATILLVSSLLHSKSSITCTSDNRNRCTEFRVIIGG